MKKFAALLIALGLVIMSLGLMSTSASADPTTVPCGTPAKPAVYETVRVKIRDAVPAQPAQPAVEASPSKWWNWSPNETQGPQDYVPAFPTDPRGTWQGPHTNGGPDGTGTFNASNGNSGNSSWFHREPAVEGRPAIPAVPAQDAVYEDRQVLVTPAVPAGEPCKTPTPEPCPDDSLDPVTCEPTETPTEKPTPPREQPKPPVGTPDQDTSEMPSKTPVAVPTAVAAGVSTLPDTGAVDFTAGLIAGGLLIGAGTLIAYKSRRRGTREA